MTFQHHNRAERGEAFSVYLFRLFGSKVEIGFIQERKAIFFRPTCVRPVVGTTEGEAVSKHQNVDAGVRKMELKNSVVKAVTKSESRCSINHAPAVENPTQATPPDRVLAR
jgi:hypothetical protein